jgi:hypothetical protein
MELGENRNPLQGRWWYKGELIQAYKRCPASNQ